MLTVAVAAAGLMQAAPAPPAAPAYGPAVVSSPLIDGLCLHVAAGAGDGPQYSRLLAVAGARPLSDAVGDTLTPVDEPTPGQVFRFEPSGPGTPAAVIDPRRGLCALVWEGHALPVSALTQIADDRPSSGPDGAPEQWRKVTAAIITRPRPPRWFIQVGGDEKQGVCADALADLRRRDKQAVSMLRLAPCRLDAAEKVEAP